MTSTKYIGMDVHKESISIAVMNSVGKVVMECVIETKASTILQFIQGLRGDLRVTFEEGTCATWLHDLLKPYVTEVVVCNPRKIASLKDGSKSDRIDAHKLAEQLYMNKIKLVYHGEHGLRTLKELTRSYLTISKDLTRVMNRLKALYRSWGIPVSATKCMHHLTVLNGSARSVKLASGDAPNPTTNSWMSCGPCARRCGGICCWRARSTRRGNCFARFQGLVRSERRFSWRFCRLLIGFVPSGSCGPIAVWD